MQGSITRKIIENTLIKRDGYVCGLCKLALSPEDGIEFHHVVHREKGGADELSNIVLVHRECHMQHHGRKVRKYNNKNKRILNDARSKYYYVIINNISHYIESGYSIAAISKILNISRPSIYDILRKFNKKTPREIKYSKV